jgi:hypothetical protein
MMRLIYAIVAGYAAWSVLWLAGNALLFGKAAEHLEQGEPYTATGPLLAVLVLSVVCSIVAGVLAARIGGAKAKAAVLITGIALLVTGIGVQTGSWSLLPLWYHLVFLALLLPVVWIGGRLGAPPGLCASR